ncbi:hypothetical protein AB0H18_34710 [Streptomyces sp. NPDC020766]|uniref:hypothetical protein n=1 Tax=Streptomyces sp. NPDC020766 TaxID=3155011 RepID=UPI0033F28C1A
MSAYFRDLQAAGRCHVNAADNFFTWLAGEGLTLGVCTQVDLERWMTDPAFRYRDETGHFVRWSVQHRHAHGLTCGAVRWTGPQGTIDSEKRWVDARRLLNEDTLPTADRVAGLLLTLYGQKISTTSQLTVEDVGFTGETVAITFGASPVILPMPLGALVRELVETRRGKAKIGTPDDVPWLFPGGQPGRPLSDSQVDLRLPKIGIRPQQDRSTALFTLAAELPAAILARMLGIHIQVAVQWQKASAGDWPPTPPMSAVVSRRTNEATDHHPPSTARIHGVQGHPTSPTSGPRQCSSTMIGTWTPTSIRMPRSESAGYGRSPPLHRAH